jgi:hypothetical protein
MKRFYVAFMGLILTAFTVNSQSLTATNQYFSGDPLFFVEGHITITNVSNSPKDVIVERVLNNIIPGHVSYFCWVNCYSAQVSVSPDHITLQAGEDTSIFRADLETNAIPGVSYVNYCFYDQNNPSDSVCVEYVFDITTGIQDIPSDKNFISKAYPNPSATVTNFFVNVAKGSKDARIKFYNMLGAQVKEVQVTDFRNSTRVNLAGLKPGIYFYSLVVDGKSTGTAKLMISKD